MTTTSADRQAEAVTNLADPVVAATVAGPPGADGFANLELDLGLVPGSDRIVVNGQDLSRSVARLSVHIDRTAPAFPIAVLELRQGAARISGPGIVQVLPSDGDAPVVAAQAVAEWIADVDPTAVDQALLSAGMGVSPGEAAVAVIAAMARTRGAST